jgi:hypothetical protein
VIDDRVPIVPSGRVIRIENHPWRVTPVVRAGWELDPPPAGEVS